MIGDLKRRGMLGSTLVVFSRIRTHAVVQKHTGRDHNPKGCTVWLAGGGVKGGTTRGATDEFGYKAIENPHDYSNLHAIILNQVGLDYKKMEFNVFGRTMWLAEDGGDPIREILVRCQMKLKTDKEKCRIARTAMLWTVASLAFVSCCSAQTAVQGSTELARATSGVQTLMAWFDPTTGLYKTTGWWNSANATTVVVDYSRISGSSEYLPAIADTFVAAQKKNPGFLNKYYDDEGWWALAWVDAWDLTGNKVFLSMAESIFADMAEGWDGTCGGGIWWSKDRKYKNAIANELFLSVAAHLANRDSAGRSDFLNWANKEWAWFLQSGMINERNLVNDGLRITAGQDGSPAACTNNGRNTWSYNQGVVLGGLAELGKLNSDPLLPSTAQKIATAAMTSLSDGEGILHDTCEPRRCGADAGQFKGIFVRNLVALYKAYPVPAYKSFIDKNANAIWERSRDSGNQLGLVWSGPFDAGNASSQSSALDAIVGAAALESQH